MTCRQVPQKNIEQAVKAGAKLFETPIQSSKIFEIMQSVKPDLVNHHAAQKSVRDSVEDPKKDADINIMGLLNVLEAARASACKKIIFASSGGVVYGEQEKFPATEGDPKRPMSPYGVSKLASELYLEFYSMQWGFDTTCLRYANVYGPRQDPQGEAGVVAIFSSRMRDQQGTIIYGPGKQTRDFVYIEDIVSANLAAGSIMKGFQTYNIGTAKETSILDLQRGLAKVARYEKPVKFEPAKSGEQLRSVLSYDLLKSKTQWSPQISLEVGLTKTFEWFSKQKA
jgi:UDP-glucose 4-epimerase